MHYSYGPSKVALWELLPINIKIYINGLFGKIYDKSKDLVKKDVGHISGGEQQNYRDVLALDNDMRDEERIKRSHKMFKEFIIPFTKESLTKPG